MQDNHVIVYLYFYSWCILLICERLKNLLDTEQVNTINKQNIYNNNKQIRDVSEQRSKSDYKNTKFKITVHILISKVIKKYII